MRRFKWWILVSVVAIALLATLPLVGADTRSPDEVADTPVPWVTRAVVASVTPSSVVLAVTPGSATWPPTSTADDLAVTVEPPRSYTPALIPESGIGPGPGQVLWAAGIGGLGLSMVAVGVATLLRRGR
jgi:hypothetical protein